MSESGPRYRGKRKEGDVLPVRRVSEDSRYRRSEDSRLWSLIRILKLLLALPVVLYLICVIVVYSRWQFLNDQIIYLNYVNNPLTNYSNPAAYGANKAVNFYIDGPVGRLGAWYIPAIKDKMRFGKFGDGAPIFLYLHGNAYSRAEWHRVVLYKVLSEMSYHVVTFDYRGFADSGGYPTEEGVIDDSLAAWQWIKKRSKNSPVYIWGHSLGSGVGTGLAKRLSAEGNPPHGLILEAPFNNIYDAGMEHQLSKPFRFLPFFKEYIMEPFKKSFRTDKRLPHVKCPVLILHDETDDIIPIKFAKKLYEETLSTRAPGLPRVQLFELHGNGHNWIIISKLIPGIMREFIEKKEVTFGDQEPDDNNNVAMDTQG